MTNYDNTNRGTIAKNAHKTEDKHPDIAGTINVEGREFWINGWARKNSRDGSSFYSLSVKPRQERAREIQEQSYREAGVSGGDALDDSIPF
jgi:hypothetical protein